MDILQKEKTCSSCNQKFFVSWWSKRSYIEAMKIEICPSCEVKLHPDDILAQWQAAQPRVQRTGKCVCGAELSNGVCPNPACEFNDFPRR